MDDFTALMAVSERDAMQFFFEHLKDLSNNQNITELELLYIASLLTHFASTSTVSTNPAVLVPTSQDMGNVFDRFILDRSQHTDPEIAEMAGAQILLFAGFFWDQMRYRYNLDWYRSLGRGLYCAAAEYSTKENRKRMCAAISHKFNPVAGLCCELHRRLRDIPFMLELPRNEQPPLII